MMLVVHKVHVDPLLERRRRKHVSLRSQLWECLMHVNLLLYWRRHGQEFRRGLFGVVVAATVIEHCRRSAHRGRATWKVMWARKDWLACSVL